MESVTQKDAWIDSVHPASEQLFAGPGRARALARSLDWAATPLGPVEAWPQSLRTAVDVCLASRFAAALLWGEQLVLIHNDAHIPALGARFPGAMGRPAPAVLSDSWPLVGALVAKALAGADADEDAEAFEPAELTLTLTRGDAPRTARFTVSVAAIRDESGRAAGVLIEAIDMTARVLAEAALVENQTKYRALIESMDEALALCEAVRDADGRLVDYRWLEVNAAQERLARTPREHMIGRLRSESALAPDPELMQLIASVLRTRGSVHLERPSATLPGWLSMTCLPLGHDRFVTLIADITDRKRAEIALRESERRQNFLLQFGDTLRSLTDDALILRTSARLLGEFLGADRCFFGELIPEDNAAFTHTEYSRGDLPGVAGRFVMSEFRETVSALERGRPYVIADVARSGVLSEHARAAYLSLGCASFFSVPLFKHGKLVLDLSAVAGRPRAWSGAEIQLAREVAERTWTVLEHARAEAALRASEARFRAVADLVPDLLWQSEPDGSASWYNARWYTYTGQTPAQATGWGWTDAVHPDDRAHIAVSYLHAIERGASLVQEPRIRRHDGVYRWFLVRAEPMRDDTGRIVRWVGSATDIHARRTALEEVERLVAERTTERDALRRRLVEAEEAERRRISRELHDRLGQHLAAFALALTEVRRLVDTGQPVHRRLTQLDELAQDMTRDARNLALELRPPELDDVGLESALRTYAEIWGQRNGVDIDVAITGGGAGRLAADAGTAIYRILQEALTNVTRHAGATHVSVLLEHPDSEVRLVVEDDGRGFEPESTTRKARDERRLGLASMRERAMLVGGTLEIESTPGQGTAVYARIPIAG